MKITSHQDVGSAVERTRRVPDVDSNCRLLIVPPFRGSSRFESLILSHHSRTKLHVSVINEVEAESRGTNELVKVMAMTNFISFSGQSLYTLLKSFPPRSPVASGQSSRVPRLGL